MLFHNQKHDFIPVFSGQHNENSNKGFGSGCETITSYGTIFFYEDLAAKELFTQKSIDKHEQEDKSTQVSNSWKALHHSLQQCLQVLPGTHKLEHTEQSHYTQYGKARWRCFLISGWLEKLYKTYHNNHKIEQVHGVGEVVFYTQAVDFK